MYTWKNPLSAFDTRVSHLTVHREPTLPGGKLCMLGSSANLKKNLLPTALIAPSTSRPTEQAAQGAVQRAHQSPLDVPTPRYDDHLDTTGKNKSCFNAERFLHIIEAT